VSADRRAHPRYELLAQITVRHGSIDHVLEVINLSRGGALVDLGREPRPPWLSIEREVSARMIDGDGHAVLEVHGRVVRIAETLHHRTFAIQFDELIDDDRVHAVLARAGRPPPLPVRDGPEGI